MKSASPATWIESAVRAFCDGPENKLWDEREEPAWADPLVGFSAGDDPLYLQYKDVVGPYHWTPLEIFGLTFPDLTVKAGELTVISWILPQTRASRLDNRKEIVYPAERWARARIFGEQVNNRLRKRVVRTLAEAGSPAVAPLLAPQWTRKDSERFVFSSTWSERHAAYAAGLGTFGLCDGLITRRGKAVRVGSVVARIAIPPTPRPYTHHREYCLFFSGEPCKKCMERCPVGAISEAGHDKLKCNDHVHVTSSGYVKSHYGFDGYACGLCQTGVPCESRIPRKTLR